MFTLICSGLALLECRLLGISVIGDLVYRVFELLLVIFEVYLPLNG